MCKCKMNGMHDLMHDFMWKFYNSFPKKIGMLHWGLFRPLKTKILKESFEKEL
jgi:hypothetical protein